MAVDDVINEIAMYFQQQGFKCDFNQEGVDLVARKGGFKKKKYLVVVGMNEFDANLALYRIKEAKAEKIVYLKEGKPAEVRDYNSKVQVVTSVREILTE